MTIQNILAPELLESIRQAFIGSSLIVEHSFLSGGRAPDSFVFDDFEGFEEYLQAHAKPGDNFWFWRYHDVCLSEKSVLHGQFPGSDGRVFEGGAY